MTLNKPVDAWKDEVVGRSDDICQSLLESLGITRLHPVAASSWNAIFRAEAGTRWYCIKVMNEESVSVDWTVEELDSIGSMTNALHGAGLACLMPPVPLHGGAYAARCAGYTVVVFPWCDGFEARELAPAKQEGQRLERFQRVGSPALHELHVVGRIVAGEAREVRTAFTRKYGPERWAQQESRLWKQCERDMTQSSAPREVLTLLARARDEGAGLQERFPEFFSTPPQEQTVLHGDFRPENILIEDGRVQLIYDFDFMRVGRAEEDVAYSALYYSGPAWFTGRRDWDLCAGFIRCYQQAARERGGGALRPALLEAALTWTVLKELSLSFRWAEVPGRYELWRELQVNMGPLMETCR